MDLIFQLVDLFQKQVTGDPLFFVLGSVTFLSALAVVLQKNLVRAGFTLIGCFGAIALIYFALGAELVAASQVLIYAVGITLVVIFAIMLLTGSSDTAEEEPVDNKSKIQKYISSGLAFALPFLVFLLMSYSFIGLSSALTPSPPYPEARIKAIVQYVDIGRSKAALIPTIERLGEILLSEQILAFELVSVLLLIAFVSAIVLSKRRA
jgi:NADH-quinone oxidoreductase subunit J